MIGSVMVVLMTMMMTITIFMSMMMNVAIFMSVMMVVATLITMMAVMLVVITKAFHGSGHGSRVGSSQDDPVRPAIFKILLTRLDPTVKVSNTS